MRQSAHRKATFDDLAALGDAARHEVLGGEVVEKAAPSPEHGRAQRAPSPCLGGPFDDDGRGGPGGWRILTEVEIQMEAHEVVRPHVAGWRREPSDEGRDRVHQTVRVRSRRRRALLDDRTRTAAARGVRAAGAAGGSTPGVGEGAVARIRPFEAIEPEVSRQFPPGPSGSGDGP